MRAIALRGEKQSGKNTAAMVIAAELSRAKPGGGFRVMEDAFAAPGKKAVAAIFDVEYEKLIGSDEDKRTIFTDLKWRDLPTNVWENHGKPDPDSYLTYRDLLTSFLNDCLKPVYGQDHWVKMLLRRFKRLRHAQPKLHPDDRTDLYLVTDCRLDIEAKALMAEGVEVWKVAGRGGSNSIHPTEAETRVTTVYTHLLDNSGTLDDLQKNVRRLLALA